MKKIPWLSLTLLLLAHSTLGWVIAAIQPDSSLCAMPWELHSGAIDCRLFSLVFTLGFILLLAETLASPFSKIRKGMIYTIGSDTRAVVLVVAVSFFAAVLVIWIHVVIHALSIVAAGLLARLDMLMVGFKDWQAFAILSLFSLVGFGLGWIAHYSIDPQTLAT